MHRSAKTATAPRAPYKAPDNTEKSCFVSLTRRQPERKAVIHETPVPAHQSTQVCRIAFRQLKAKCGKQLQRRYKAECGGRPPCANRARACRCSVGQQSAAIQMLARRRINAVVVPAFGLLVTPSPRARTLLPWAARQRSAGRPSILTHTQAVAHAHGQSRPAS